MKSLQTLLKLTQRRLDDLGVEAAKCALRIDEMRMKEAGLLAREMAEVETALADFTLMSMMPAYQARMKLQVLDIRRQVADGEETLRLVREQLTEAYQEKAKFEQLIEQEKVREARRLAELEQAQLDEAAINRVGR